MEDEKFNKIKEYLKLKKVLEENKKSIKMVDEIFDEVLKDNGKDDE